MKKFTKIFSFSILLLISLFSAVSLTSCNDNDYWWDEPGWNNTFNDYRLQGYWMLVQYNSDPVSPREANYMYFNGNGRGLYFYLDNGYQQTEDMRYWCQQAYDATSNYQINIQYQYSSPLTSNYWFTHNNDTLWLQWRTNGGRVITYVYDRINYAPW